MRNTELSLTAVGLILLGACSALAPSGSCRISAKEALMFPLLEDEDPMVGSLYRLQGIFYVGFEEHGLIAGTDVSPKAIEDGKWFAYCHLVERHCDRSIGRVRDRKSKDILALIDAIVRFDGPGGVAHETDINQCQRGTVTIVRIIAIRPITR
ncbi:MAG: hypothetical protein GY835_02870 [bacterium]|nr:hypothetical protein [bacterium]